MVTYNHIATVIILAVIKLYVSEAKGAKRGITNTLKAVQVLSLDQNRRCEIVQQNTNYGNVLESYGIRRLRTISNKKDRKKAGFPIFNG